MALPYRQDELALAAALGGRIRTAREAAGLTLRRLAEATGLSQPFLSRLERGQVSASIANLLEIARALRLSVAALLEGEAPTPARSWAVHRGGAALPGDGYSFRQLAPALRRRRMDAFVLDFPPGRAQELVVAHEGEELLYVLEGRVRFRFGEEEALLGPGDAVQFDSSLPHSAANEGPKPARLLMVATPSRAEPFGWLRAPARPANRETRRRR
jgi:transcriptional regulator with XRE-family HTH domain